METVYLETTFISYLVARPSRDLLVAAHQQVTHDWWAKRRDQFECFVSQVVLDEVSLGDEDEVRKRLDALRQVDVLLVTDAAATLAKEIISTGVLPHRAFPDVAHVAVATVHEVEYLLTWNCKHLANYSNM
jgi:hypothetical protein